MEEQGRILGLDVGERRIGVALSDPFGLMANPLEVIQRVTFQIDIRRIAQLAAEHEAVRIVVGMPISMDGVARQQAHIVEEFRQKLAAAVTLPVDPWDERLSTVQAEQRMLEAGMGAAKRKARRDAAAAAVILQAYLDSHR